MWNEANVLKFKAIWRRERWIIWSFVIEIEACEILIIAVVYFSHFHSWIYCSCMHHVCTYVCMYVCVCICGVCMYVCMYIHSKIVATRYDFIPVRKMSMVHGLFTTIGPLGIFLCLAPKYFTLSKTRWLFSSMWKIWL